MKLVCIVHYNTPILTLACIRSLFKSTRDVKVLVFDNSDACPFAVPDVFADKIEIIDNTRGNIIDFDRWLSRFNDKAPTDNGYASAKHCYTVQWLIDNINQPFLLMDSDVLVRRDVSPMFDDNYVYVGEEKMHKSRFGNLMRVLPFLCYVNVPLLKQHSILFCHPQKIFSLSRKYTDAAYDTGCWFYEDCLRRNAPVRNVSVADYAIHFGHGSWKSKNSEEWIELHSELWK